MSTKVRHQKELITLQIKCLIRKKSAVQKSDSINTIAQSLAAESGFDQNKVNIIKQQIQSGNYPLDSRKIAESFLSLEKLID